MLLKIKVKYRNHISNYQVVCKTYLLFIMLFASSMFAQQQNSSGNIQTITSTNFVRCATVEHEKKLAQENPEKTSKAAFESWMNTKMSQIKLNSANGKIAAQEYTIPVVIHIVHNGDEVNSVGNVVGENISDAQAISQIEVLNQDFRKIVNTPGGANSTGLAVDVEINFCLAQQDADGFETTGIVRHNIAPYTDDVENESINNVGRGGADWETYDDVQKMKEETQWDPEKYLNIWTIRTGGGDVNEGEGLDGLLGYAQFPSNSTLSGLNNYEGSSDTDGVVIAYHAFGNSTQSDGSFIMNNQYNEGRTTTHEVGHWLGLRHIWGDAEDGENGCDVDDFCLDTPNARDAHYNCNRVYDSCTDDDSNDMVENYMDYTPDTCMDTFTQDQKDRMITVLNNSPRRVELLSSIGCDPPLYTQKELEAFIVDPNPVVDNVTVIGSTEGIVKISIFDAYGKEIYYNKYNHTDGFFSQEIELTYLAAGIYIVLIENEGEKRVKRIIKK